VAIPVAVGAGGYGHLLGGSAVVVAALTLALCVADPDFNVDDWIRWFGGEGVVEAISCRVTRVRMRVAFWVVDPQRADVLRVRSAFFQRAVARLDGMDAVVSPPSQHELSGDVTTGGAFTSYRD
jgi:hypothetical protein